MVFDPFPTVRYVKPLRHNFLSRTARYLRSVAETIQQCHLKALESEL